MMRYSLDQPYERIGSARLGVTNAVQTVDLPLIPGWGSIATDPQFLIPTWILLEVEPPAVGTPIEIYWAFNEDPVQNTVGAVTYGSPCHIAGAGGPVWIPIQRSRNATTGVGGELRLVATAAGPVEVALNLVRLHPQRQVK